MLYHVSDKSFDEFIKRLDKEGMKQRNRGTLFELISKAFFKYDTLYSRLFDEVWMLNEVPEEYDIPKVDLGVDLVARKRDTGELVAIQCKYYKADTKINKSHIDSFFNELGKNYYSEGILVATTNIWSKNAERARISRSKRLTLVKLDDMRNSAIDWSKFLDTEPNKITLKHRKMPRPHQIPAIESVLEGFKTKDRGKLIMAPGTGKTYTSMVIAEEMAKKKEGQFRVLYLVPSIQLLSQSLRGWSNDSYFRDEMDTFAVCSDTKVTKETTGNEFEDLSAEDLGFPATTDYQKLIENQQRLEQKDIQSKFLVVFSTYQSIDVITQAQKDGFYEFDLIVCDEAHRTTGAFEQGREESSFTKVHSNFKVKAVKRLYQTATPRIYGESARQKADELSMVIADMNDEAIYGQEFYRIGFGDAVNKGILTDYRVMVLAVDEKVIASQFQGMLANNQSELEFDDVTKIVGCWNGLIKRKNNSDETFGVPMKRAIAFAGTIKDSKKITEMFKSVVNEYLGNSLSAKKPVRIEIDHADGSMNALEKNEKINWLKSDVPDNTCRILSNARFLTEGVDVPDLDAVMFLAPRKSKIDIAQAVGRVMRKAPNKDYGYVILPIGIPANKSAEEALNNNDKYKVVWEVLNALRSLDERFDSMINKLNLNNKRPNNFGLIGVGKAPNDRGDDCVEIPKHRQEIATQLSMNFDGDEISELERVIYGKIVKKVGNVRYWEDWSKDVANIAEQHKMRIETMLEDKKSNTYHAFNEFLKGLHYNINDSISEEQAIEMLAQHLITRPVFESLFNSYNFVNDNPISKAMNSVLREMNEQGLLKEQESLKGFYESVKLKAAGIDNLKAKQDIIIKLYDSFFKHSARDTVERLGIVFTPTEVVDFIIHSVNDVLIKHFGKTISDEGVHVLDPFTGTGTFIVRLLQSGLINKDDLIRKYTKELHANEIVLLSYYIAAINIEETYHELMGGYKTFDGIVLTDTFATTEIKYTKSSEIFDENNRRLAYQKESPIFAIIGNPPYSVGQSSENDNNQNTNYPELDESIANTYAKYSKAKAKKSLYDSYIKSFKWSTNRIKNNGIIAFVTNGAFIDNAAMDGLRKCWHEEFNYIYVFNLRGDQRTLGEKSRKEGGKIFGSGSRTPVAITLLVKDGSDRHEIFYKDIGDYLTREEKLKILEESQSIKNVNWNKIEPDKNNDWINQREEDYESYPSMVGDIFSIYAPGVLTARDSWTINFSKKNTYNNAKRMIDNYNYEILRLKNSEKAMDEINTAEDYIKWSTSLKQLFKKKQELFISEQNIIQTSYRPFTKKYMSYEKGIIHRPAGWNEKYNPNFPIIYTTGVGISKSFSALMIKNIPNFHFMDTGKGYIVKPEHDGGANFSISEDFLSRLGITSEEALYYVYGVLHSPEFKQKYENNLNKEVPRIPILKYKEKYIEIGRQLADLHLNYEDIEPYSEINIQAKENPSYKVTKMKHPKKGVLDTIIFNGDITITNIPGKAYEYIVNGRSAIGWIMDQYKVKTDKKSGIIDDPNLYSDDEKYIFKLLLSIINLSVQTVDLVKSLPPLEIEE